LEKVKSLEDVEMEKYKKKLDEMEVNQVKEFDK